MVEKLNVSVLNAIRGFSSRKLYGKYASNFSYVTKIGSSFNLQDLIKIDKTTLKEMRKCTKAVRHLVVMIPPNRAISISKNKVVLREASMERAVDHLVIRINCNTGESLELAPWYEVALERAYSGEYSLLEANLSTSFNEIVEIDEELKKKFEKKIKLNAQIFVKYIYDFE